MAYQRNNSEVPPPPWSSLIIPSFPSSISTPAPALTSASTPPTLPPLSFPPAISTPPLPIRLEPQTPMLNGLTAEYDAKGPHPVISEVGHQEKAQIDALKVLHQHIRDRIPFAQAASSRLQAAVGIRNDLPFSLSMDNRVGEDAHITSKEESKANTQAQTPPSHIITSPSNSPTNPPQFLSTLASSTRNTNLRHALHAPHAFLDRSRLRAVNTFTGAGLREYLLMRGSMTGSKKRSCKSISFHDFTPDMREGRFRNQLLMHWGVDDGVGSAGMQRIEVGEVDLPDQNGNLHPWLNILIQRPLITLSHIATNHPTPPNFPHQGPPPCSWLVFAAPLSHISTYPIQTDSSLPVSLLKTTLNSHGIPTKKVALRQDFDFSFQGVPIFEFSEKPTPALFHSHPSSSNTPHPSPQYLNVSMPPYDHLSDNRYTILHAEAVQDKAYLEELAWQYFSAAGGTEEQFTELVAAGLEECPFEGEWWHKWFIQVTRERIRWEKIREAMARGKCRVVVRWQEVRAEGQEAAVSAGEGGDLHQGKKRMLGENIGPGGGTAGGDMRQKSMAVDREIVTNEMEAVAVTASLRGKALRDRPSGVGLGLTGLNGRDKSDAERRRG